MNINFQITYLLSILEDLMWLLGKSREQDRKAGVGGVGGVGGGWVARIGTHGNLTQMIQ